MESPREGICTSPERQRFNYDNPPSLAPSLPPSLPRSLPSSHPPLPLSPSLHPSLLPPLSLSLARWLSRSLPLSLSLPPHLPPSLLPSLPLCPLRGTRFLYHVTVLPPSPQVRNAPKSCPPPARLRGIAFRRYRVRPSSETSPPRTSPPATTRTHYPTPIAAAARLAGVAEVSPSDRPGEGPTGRPVSPPARHGRGELSRWGFLGLRHGISRLR